MAHGHARLIRTAGVDRPTRRCHASGGQVRSGRVTLRPGGGRLTAVLPLALIGLGIAWPFAAIARRGFTDTTPARLLTDGRLRQVLWFTTWQAVLSTALTLAAGLVPAMVLARYRVFGRRLVRSLVTVPFVLPTVVVATAFLSLLPTGLRRTVPGLLITHAWVNLAIVVRAVGGRVAQIDPSLEDAAVMLGASRPGAFVRVTLPQLRGAIAGAASVVFLFCFTSFGLARLVGGPSHPTVEVEIWRRTTQSFDIPAAAALAVGQLVVVGLALWIVGRWQRRSVIGRLHGGSRLRLAARGAERTVVALTVSATGLIVAAPLAVLAWRSLRPGTSLGLAGWRALTADGRGTDAPIASVLVSVRAAAVSEDFKLRIEANTEEKTVTITL